MKLSKKLFIGISSLVIPAAAIVAPVSCENDKQQDVFAKVDNDTAIYNVATVSRGDKFIEHILNQINVQMPDIFTEFAPSNETKLKDVEKYLNDAFPGASKIKLVNHSSTYTLDFSGVKKNIEELRKTAALGYDNMKLVKHADAKDKNEFGTALGLMVEKVVPIDYSKMILGMSARKSSSFLEMFNFKDIKMREITDDELTAENPWNLPDYGIHEKGDLLPVWSEVINTHPYLNMLNEYHKVLWQFKNSKFFTEWGQNKTFTVATTTGKPGGPTYTDGKKSEVLAKSGELFDLPDSMNFYKVPQVPIYTPETSNLEISFFHRLLRIDKAI